MNPKYLKSSTVIFSIVLLISACEPNEGFKINGVLHGNYEGYLYLYFDEYKDSSLVQNGKFSFEGKIPNNVMFRAYFSTQRTSAMNKNFFLENKDIQMDVSIEERKINDYPIDWFTINKISGTQTSLIEKDYDSFKESHQHDSDWRNKNYSKIDEIVTKYPRSQYAGDLVRIATSDSLLDTLILQRIFIKLDSTAQDSDMMNRIRRIIYPSRSQKIGKTMMDFELLNEVGESINTEQYRGVVLLIDFWASWCKPCIAQFPEMKKIYQEYSDKNFKILSVSIDRNKALWESALEKEQLPWDNVWDSNFNSSKIQEAYDVDYIPSTYLIDEQGTVVAFNPSFEKLEAFLSEKIKLEVPKL
jgi:peroxiredoxin